MTAIVRYIDDTRAGEGFFGMVEELALLRAGRLTEPLGVVEGSTENAAVHPSRRRPR